MGKGFDMRPMQPASKKIVDFLNKHGDTKYKEAIQKDSSLAQFPRSKYDGVKFQWKSGKLTSTATAKAPTKKLGVAKVMKKSKRTVKAIVAPKRRNQTIATDYNSALEFVKTHGNVDKARAYIATQRAQLDTQEQQIAEVESLLKQVRAVA